VWSLKIKWCCGPNVEKMGGCVKSLCPIFRRHRGLNKERTNNIVRGPDGSLSFAILGRGVGARESQSCAMRREKEAICVIVEFLAIVTLNSANGCVKMSAHISIKMREGRVHIRFQL
jgi:hypothetical protein